MNETQRRIQAYKEALPGLRERVIAVALLLAMSAAMMTSASFAWLTISRRPEITGVNTTIASNGNLEIALATGDGEQPGESKVGDSSAAEGQAVTDANITWGNLVNLADPSYGLENLTLRPAQLNTALLLESPLYGAMYGLDGRITQLSSNFGYAIWNPPDGNKPGYFGVSENLGVRAISSTKIEAVGAELVYVNMVTMARNTNLAAANTYTALGNNDKYMPSLATMMGLYMTARMNPSNATLSNPDCSIEDIQNLRDMYAAFLGAFDVEADAIAELINLQLFLLNGEGNYEVHDREMVYGTTEAELKALGVQISSLNQFIKDHNTIASDLEKLKVLCTSGTSLKWKDSGLNDIVNNLVNVGACTIGADNTPISSIGASNALGYLSGTQEARITNGILYRFEERTGGYIQVKNLGISATVERSGITIPATVRANIQTTAPRDYNLFTNDLNYSESLNTGDFKGGIPVAQDTYGLAIDLWVRTNAANSYLTLEGNVLTTTENVRATGTDANGNTVELYTVTLTSTGEDGESISYTVDVYQVVTKTTSEDGTETVTWRNAENHSVLTEEELGDAVPIAKMEELVTVIGYEGENRIWGDNEDLSVDSTTQGSGSCYVYYADTPEDQARSLKLLEAFNVAFIDDKGKLLATAVMDTEHFYAASGRVIVPLVLSTSNSINLGENYDGTITYAITALEKNVATRVTAIVYLDGTKLTNDEVLAAADIHGQLNIQFGSSEEMDPIGNEELESAERVVRASVDITAFDFDSATGPMTTNVTVNVDGDEPSTVTAFFLRSVNATQGSREETMTFTKDPDSGNWVSSYTFTAPGEYVLRTVRLDGVDYDLSATPTVTITGFAVNSLVCQQATEGNHVNVMTAASSSTVNLNLKFAADDVSKMPSTVQGRYLRDGDGSAVNIDFNYNPSTGLWTGSGTFLTSGTYTMQYLVLDGEYAELPAGLWQTAGVTLGMRVAIYTTSPQTFKYVPSEMADNEKLLAMQVKIMDNAGKEMPGLTGVKLTYTMRGSGVKKMDTDLAWDGSYYVGELTTTGPGIWQFSNVVVGSNTLTNSTTSPVFTVQSPEPPEYYAHNTTAYQYKPNNDAVMNVQITHSAAATVQAYMIKAGAAEGTWVNGSLGGTNDATAVTNWTFQVPKDANGYQDGNWKLTALRLWDVFAEDGSPYTEENPLEIDISETNNVTKVVNRVYVTFTAGQSKDFGKDADDNVTAQFMTSHTISGLSVDIKDFEGNALQGVTDVQLTFAYKNGTSGTYGHYTSSQLTNATNGATITVALDTNSGTNYAQSDDATILYAGEYITTFSFKISGTEYKYAGSWDDNQAGTKALPDNAPVFTVSSKAATVTVAGTNPTPGTTYRIYSVSQPTNTNQLVEGDFFKYTNYAASVYIYTPRKSGSIDAEGAHAYAPEVTLALSGVPTGYSDATMTFTTSNAQSMNSTFTFGSGTTAKTTIGKAVDGKEATFLGAAIGIDTYPQSYPAGRMTQNKMSLNYNGLVFEMTLSNAIVIDQPQAPTVLKYLGIPESYTGTIPAQVPGNGTTVTVTLPKLEWTARIEEPVDGTWSAYTSVGEVTNANGDPQGRVYGYRYYETKNACGGTDEHHEYQYYIWTKFQSSITAETNIYTQDKKITKWVINGKTYNAGTTIQLTAEGVITATAVVEDAGEKEFVETIEQTTYKYLYGYVKESSVRTSANGGSQIGGTVGQNATFPTVALANTATANAATDTPGTNMTTDPEAYDQYHP